MIRNTLKYYLIIAVLVISGSKLLGQSKEQVIAAYLKSIAQYIEWEDEREADDKTFTIAVVGDNYMCDLLKEAYKSRKIKDLPVEVVCLNRVTYQANIDLLFLVSDKPKELEQAVELCGKEKFLLVTEADGFALKGAHINFYFNENQNLLFEMNKSALDKNGFKVDFYLLNFAKVVGN